MIGQRSADVAERGRFIGTGAIVGRTQITVCRQIRDQLAEGFTGIGARAQMQSTDGRTQIEFRRSGCGLIVEAQRDFEQTEFDEADQLRGGQYGDFGDR